MELKVKNWYLSEEKDFLIYLKELGGICGFKINKTSIKWYDKISLPKTKVWEKDTNFLAKLMRVEALNRGLFQVLLDEDLDGSTGYETNYNIGLHTSNTTYWSSYGKLFENGIWLDNKWVKKEKNSVEKTKLLLSAEILSIWINSGDNFFNKKYNLWEKKIKTFIKDRFIVKYTFIDGKVAIELSGNDKICIAYFRFDDFYKKCDSTYRSKYYEDLKIELKEFNDDVQTLKKIQIIKVKNFSK
jgi:hypothetical protein